MPNYFYYDGDQRRIITEDSQGRTYFLYDGEKVGVEKNASGTTQAAYVNQGPSIYSPLIYMDRSGTKSYHLLNHLGTALALASSAQALTDTYRWNAWGVELASTGSTTNPFGHVGELGYYNDPDLPFLRIGARRYVPGAARFLQRDPQDATTYAFVEAAPLVLTDPEGEVAPAVAAAGYVLFCAAVAWGGYEVVHLYTPKNKEQLDFEECCHSQRPACQPQGAWEVKRGKRSFECWHPPDMPCQETKYTIRVRYKRRNGWSNWKEAKLRGGGRCTI